MRTLDEKDADKFRKDSAAYTKKVTKTKETARRALIDMGIYTEDGKIHKDYGGRDV